LIRNHGENLADKDGFRTKSLVNMLGFNFRMTEIEAAIAYEQLMKMEALNHHRLRMAELYDARLGQLPELTIPAVRPGCTHVYYMYPILFNRDVARVSREAYVNAIKAEGISCQLLLGGKRKREEQQQTKCTVATYKLLEMGYDDKTIDTLILCTPKSTIQQTVGRVEREAPGKAVPLVIDIVDDNPMLQGMWKKRKSFYASRGYRLE
jgi:hypothetical protein